jgi:hypothetical protein
VIWLGIKKEFGLGSLQLEKLANNDINIIVDEEQFLKELLYTKV